MPNRKALVVGINDYLGTVNDLPSCVNDANAFAALIQTEPYGFQDVRILLDAQATIQNVTDGLQWLCGSQPGSSQATPEDRLIFYFSGHGYRTERDGVLRECLVLAPADFFFDNELVQQTQGIPPGILTVLLDSCHSGGMDKRFFEVLGSQGGPKALAAAVSDIAAPVERVRVKTWIPEDPEQFAKTFTAEESLIPYKAFGRATVSRLTSVSKELAQPLKALKLAEVSAEPQVNGLMITACRADQTASASSSQTQGKSAFTFSLLDSVLRLGTVPPGLSGLTNNSLFDSVGQDLVANQFVQTPVLIDPPDAPDLGDRTFLTLQPVPGSAESAKQPAPGTTPPAPGTIPPAPGTTPPAPGTTQPWPGPTQPAPGTTQPTPGIMPPMPGTRPTPPAPGTTQPWPGPTQPAPGTTQPTPGIMPPMPGTRPPMPGTTPPWPGPTPPWPGTTPPTPGDLSASVSRGVVTSTSPKEFESPVTTTRTTNQGERPMATQTIDDATVRAVLSNLMQNYTNKGFATLQPQPVFMDNGTLDDGTLQALIAAFTGPASSTTQGTPGKAFAGTTPPAPLSEGVMRVLPTVLPSILKAMQQEKAYQASTSPGKGWDVGQTIQDVGQAVQTGMQIAQGISSILSLF